MNIKPYELPVAGPHSPRRWLEHLKGSFTGRLTPKRLVIGSALAGCTVAMGLAGGFLWPRTVQVSYVHKNCFVNPTLLPAAVTATQSRSYKATLTPSLSIAGLPLYSHTTCIIPVHAPTERSTEAIALHPAGSAVLKKHIRVLTGNFPKVASIQPVTKPISTKEPLVFVLDSADSVFSYRLQVVDKTAACTKRSSTLSCDIAALHLAQSATYAFSLYREFKNTSAGTLLTRSFTTAQAMQVTASSIAQDQTVYDTPTELTLTLGRPAVTIDNMRLLRKTDGGEETVATTTEQKDAVITVRFAAPLPRSSEYMLLLDNLTAADGGYLATPYTLTFRTSGGPKVLGTNIGTYKTLPTATVTLAFDSDVLASQALASSIRLEHSGKLVDTSLAVHGKNVTITPRQALPRCTPFSVKVLDGLQNSFGVSGGSAWQFNSRTICQTVFSIGTSVQGRSITAYRFGNGPSKVIYIGTTHGDEQSTTATLNRWIDALEANPGGIAAHRSIIVIPTLNPDGYAASRRVNARNVDLNRNFPANNWKQGVAMPDKSFNPNGGGTTPLSEPESKALADYILSQSPRLVLTYHATGGVVIPNDAGDSPTLAAFYDQKSNVSHVSNSLTNVLFPYDTTGSLEDWLHDSPGIAALLIELHTRTANELTGNQQAMWHMAQLP